MHNLSWVRCLCPSCLTSNPKWRSIMTVSEHVTFWKLVIVVWIVEIKKKTWLCPLTEKVMRHILTCVGDVIGSTLRVSYWTLFAYHWVQYDQHDVVIRLNYSYWTTIDRFYYHLKTIYALRLNAMLLSYHRTINALEYNFMVNAGVAMKKRAKVLTDLASQANVSARQINLAHLFREPGVSGLLAKTLPTMFTK